MSRMSARARGWHCLAAPIALACGLACSSLPDGEERVRGALEVRTGAAAAQADAAKSPAASEDELVALALRNNAGFRAAQCALPRARSSRAARSLSCTRRSASPVPGHEIEHPMAVVIVGGLVTSTALNLFLLPALYLRYARREPGRLLEQ